jgi:hypothetical protein
MLVKTLFVSFPLLLFCALAPAAQASSSASLKPCKHLERAKEKDVQALRHFKLAQTLPSDGVVRDRHYSVDMKYVDDVVKEVESITLHAGPTAPGARNVFVMRYQVAMGGGPDHNVLVPFEKYFWLDRKDACAVPQGDIMSSTFVYVKTDIYQMVP